MSFADRGRGAVDGLAWSDAIKVAAYYARFNVYVPVSLTVTVARDAARRPGCIVLDSRLGDVQAFLHTWHSTPVAMPVIVAVGRHEAAKAMEAIQDGAWTAIERSFDLDEIEAVLRQAVMADRAKLDWWARWEWLWNGLTALSPDERALVKRLLAGEVGAMTARRLGVPKRCVQANLRRILARLPLLDELALVRCVWQAQLSFPTSPIANANSSCPFEDWL
jgi:two-component system response regulator DctR